MMSMMITVTPLELIGYALLAIVGVAWACLFVLDRVLRWLAPRKDRQ